MLYLVYVTNKKNNIVFVFGMYGVSLAFKRLAADVWATGVLMVVMTTFSHPFLLDGSETDPMLQ